MKQRYNPTEHHELDTVIKSSYDDFVRAERRNLLLISCLTLFVYYTGADVSNVKILGVEFKSLTSGSLYFLSTLVIFYFFIAYSVYALPSFRVASKEWKKSKGDGMSILGKIRWKVLISNNISEIRYFIWLFIHYFFPLLLGLCAFIISILNIA